MDKTKHSEACGARARARSAIVTDPVDKMLAGHNHAMAADAHKWDADSAMKDAASTENPETAARNVAIAGHHLTMAEEHKTAANNLREKAPGAVPEPTPVPVFKRTRRK